MINKEEMHSLDSGRFIQLKSENKREHSSKNRSLHNSLRSKGEVVSRKEYLEHVETLTRRLKQHTLISTTKAGSGHPTSCLSCAEIVATLFTGYLRYDVRQPESPLNDRFVLSKGHAAPILWAMLAEKGAFPRKDILNLRNFESILEGHPTPRAPWVDVATGSLGQGLAIGLGMAMASKMDQQTNMIYVLLGDGEMHEGAVWEAAALADRYALDNLVAIVDVNRIAQSEETIHGRDAGAYAQKLEAFGWKSCIVDGHNVDDLWHAYEDAIENRGKPFAIIANTIKGKGVSFLENRENKHGKTLAEKELNKALDELKTKPYTEESFTLDPNPFKGHGKNSICSHLCFFLE